MSNTSHIGPYIFHMGPDITAVAAALQSPRLIVGIDRLTVGFRCLPPPASAFWHTRTFQRGKMTAGQQQVVIARGSRAITARLTFLDSRTFQGVFVTFNPSRLIDPDGTGLASVSDVPQMLRDVIHPLLPPVVPVPPIDTWDLYRLDLAVDVESGGMTQQVLRTAFDHAYRPRHHTYAYRNGPSALGTVGRRSVTRPRLNIYDKAAEAKWGAPRVRFEVQCRREALRALSLSTVGNLDAVSARRVFIDELAEVTHGLGSKGAQVAVHQLTPTDKKTFLELLGIEALRANGVEVEVSPSATRRYRKLLNSYGASVAGGLSFNP